MGDILVVTVVIWVTLSVGVQSQVHCNVSYYINLGNRTSIPFYTFSLYSTSLSDCLKKCTLNKACAGIGYKKGYDFLNCLIYDIEDYNGNSNSCPEECDFHKKMCIGGVSTIAPTKKISTPSTNHSGTVDEHFTRDLFTTVSAEEKEKPYQSLITKLNQISSVSSNLQTNKDNMQDPILVTRQTSTSQQIVTSKEMKETDIEISSMSGLTQDHVTGNIDEIKTSTLEKMLRQNWTLTPDLMGQTITTDDVLDSTKQSSTKPIYNTSSSNNICTCTCYSTEKTYLELITERKAILQMKKDEMSSSKRKRSSVVDSRQSVRNIGYIGAIVLALVGTLIILLDCFPFIYSLVCYKS